MDRELMKKLVLVMMNETSWEDKEVEFKAVLSWKGYPFVLINELEEEAASLEQQLEQLNMKLADPSKYAEEIKSGELYQQHDRLSKALEEVYALWEDRHLELEKLMEV